MPKKRNVQEGDDNSRLRKLELKNQAFKAMREYLENAL